MSTTCMLSVYLCLVLITGCYASCPKRPSDGFWKDDQLNGRCILKCYSGFEPSSCHVLRRQQGQEEWNHKIPTCQKESLVSGKTIMVLGAGTAAVVALPAVLAGAGFTAAGVAAGSLAAWVQTSCTAAGGWFAAAQSAGALGAAATTKAGVGAAVATATGAVSSYLSDCELE
ncbi:interferon alpha-inducible protein 27-like protein 2B isoform X2 [Ostrea edulis]|uniref:interferon alpha-inducible protein 27-like protein 2B isoform X2 n=1 Tax=Ostrea edulis TaxID=37623 RepID=UPI0024AF56DC|nr:interferon alpha-inducible protein 27-like protein 2B isoform X2 [Ostrea edulis]